MSSLKLNKLKCCICGNVWSSTQPLFKMPNSEDRLKRWVHLLNREDLLELNRSYLNHSAKVCGKHFSDWAYTGTDKKRLIAFAMPETAEPPVSVLPPNLQVTTTQPSINSNLQVGTCSDTSLLAEPNIAQQLQAATTVSTTHQLQAATTVSTTHQLQAATTASSISSGPQVLPTKFLQLRPFRPLLPSVKPKPCVPVPAVNPQPTVPAPSATSAPLKRTREQRIILNQRAMIYRLRKKIKKMEKFKISFDEHLRKKLTPDMYSFVKSQIRQSGRPNKGKRWRKEDKDFALTVYKKSPSVYKLLQTKLALPSEHTLRRYS